MKKDRSQPSFGIIFHPTFPPESLADFACQAEAVGFDELWLWDDCFLPGALTSAAIALSATRYLKVGIGLIPATVYNPLFVAMEITTLARAFPGRIMPGFGYGVPTWMSQIGAAPKSFLNSLSETVKAVRALLAGEKVTMHGTQVNLDDVQMQMTPKEAVPIHIGGMRAKTLQLAGRAADGAILTDMSSPAYVRWARDQIQIGMDEAGRTKYHLVVNVDVKVNPDGEIAQSAARRSLANRLPWADIHMKALGIEQEMATFIEAHGSEGLSKRMPDAWLDAFAASGTPEQVTGALQRLVGAGADTLVFQPLDGDAACMDEYARYLMPQLCHLL